MQRKGEKRRLDSEEEDAACPGARSEALSA